MTHPTAFDSLTVGDVTTPNEGILRIGDGSGPQTFARFRHAGGANMTLQTPVVMAGTYTLFTTAGDQDVTDGGDFTIDALSATTGTFSNSLTAGSAVDSADMHSLYGRLAVFGGTGINTQNVLVRQTNTGTGGVLVLSLHAYSSVSASAGFGPELRFVFRDAEQASDQGFAALLGIRHTNDTSGRLQAAIWDNNVRRTGLNMFPDGTGGVKFVMGSGTATYNDQVYAGDSLYVNGILLADASLNMPNIGSLTASGLLKTTDSIYSTKGIRTDADVWRGTTAYTNPDFVFEHYYDGESGNPEYTGLMPLPELDKYLKKHRRLPGITDKPTGAFERLDIALEKIEQLTLYIIEQDKRIRELEARR